MIIGRIAEILSQTDKAISSLALEVSKEGSETRRCVTILTRNTPRVSDNSTELMI
jgi:hypothetical protein